MELYGIMLCEINKTKKDKLCMISLRCEIYINKPKECIKQKQSHSYRKKNKQTGDTRSYENKKHQPREVCK